MNQNYLCQKLISQSRPLKRKRSGVTREREFRLLNQLTREKLLNTRAGSQSQLTLSLPRVINVKIPLQPHKKYDTTQYGELDFS